MFDRFIARIAANLIMSSDDVLEQMLHHVLLLHNEPRFTSITNPLQEVVGEPTESITVGNDNF
jgi:hypothetical protein